MVPDGPKTKAFKKTLMKLIGRQTKIARHLTAPELVAGCWWLMSILTVLETTDLDALQRMASKISLPVAVCRSGSFCRYRGLEAADSLRICPELTIVVHG